MDGAEVRSAAGDAGSVDPAHARAGTDARVGDLATDPAALERRAAGQPGIALSRAAPARAAGPDRSGMGQLGKQSPGQVLPAHAGRAEAARRGAEELGAPFHRGRARARRALIHEVTYDPPSLGPPGIAVRPRAPRARARRR